MYRNNSNHLAVAFGLACLSLGVIYVVFGPNLSLTQPVSPHKTKKRRKAAIQINGLENAGSNCYVNVIVQALSASDSFIAWLKESLVQQELFTPNLTNPQQQPLVRFIQYLFSIILRNNSLYESIVGPLSQPATIKFCAEKTLTFQLLKLMQEVNGEHSPGISLNANRLLEILHNFNFESRNEQQDAHELFNFLTASLENEILRTLTATDLSLNGIQTNGTHQNGLHPPNETDQPTTSGQAAKTGGDLGGLQAKKCGEIREDRTLNMANEYVPIKKSLNLKRNLPTSGLLAHQMCCLRCYHKFTIQFESFHSISLPLVPRALKRLDESITLKDCLNRFVSCEILKDVVCENCQRIDRESAGQSGSSSTTNPKMKSTFAKRLTFAKLPQLLVIHLQRLVCLPNGMPIKKEDRVRFPSILVMDEYEHNAIQQRSNINILSEFDWSGGSAAPSARSDNLDPSNVSGNFEGSSKNVESLANQRSAERVATMLNSSKTSLPESASTNESDAVNDDHHPDHANLSNNNGDRSSPIASSNSSTPIKQANEREAISVSCNVQANDVEDSVPLNCCSDCTEPEGCNGGIADSQQSGESGLTSATTMRPVQQQTTEPSVSTSLSAAGSNLANCISSESASASTTNSQLNNSQSANCTSENDPKETGDCSNSERHNTRSNNGTTGDSHKLAISAESETKATDEYAESELSSNKTSSNSIKFSSDLMASKQAPRKDAKYRYKLNASIVHLGSCFSGHYIGHRRKPADCDANLNNEPSGDWYYTSDSVVRPSSLDDALRSNGYMLFYERIK